MKAKNALPSTSKPAAPRRPSATEDARLDAEADREFSAGLGIPAEELRAWLHDRIDGGKAPPPKARKLF